MKKFLVLLFITNLFNLYAESDVGEIVLSGKPIDTSLIGFSVPGSEIESIIGLQTDINFEKSDEVLPNQILSTNFSSPFEKDPSSIGNRVQYSISLGSIEFPAPNQIYPTNVLSEDELYANNYTVNYLGAGLAVTFFGTRNPNSDYLTVEQQKDLDELYLKYINATETSGAKRQAKEELMSYIWRDINRKSLRQFSVNIGIEGKIGTDLNSFGGSIKPYLNAGIGKDIFDFIINSSYEYYIPTELVYETSIFSCALLSTIDLSENFPPSALGFGAHYSRREYKELIQNDQSFNPINNQISLILLGKGIHLDSDTNSGAIGVKGDILYDNDWIYQSFSFSVLVSANMRVFTGTD